MAECRTPPRQNRGPYSLGDRVPRGDGENLERRRDRAWVVRAAAAPIRSGQRRAGGTASSLVRSRSNCPAAAPAPGPTCPENRPQASWVSAKTESAGTAPV